MMEALFRMMCILLHMENHEQITAVSCPMEGAPVVQRPNSYHD